MVISNSLSVLYHTVVRYNINKSEVFIWTLPKESNPFLKRNSLPSIGTLESICKGFGITLSEFFAEGDLIEVSSDTKQLIEYWGGLSPTQKKTILELVKNMNQK